MTKLTDSNNEGLGFCCKPHSKRIECNTGPEFICSQAPDEDHTLDKFAGIITKSDHKNN